MNNNESPQPTSTPPQAADVSVMEKLIKKTTTAKKGNLNKTQHFLIASDQVVIARLS